MPAYMTRYQIRCIYGESPKKQTKTARWGEDIEIKQKSSSVSEHNKSKKKLKHAELINKVKELEERVEELEKLLKKHEINSDDSYDSDCSVESDDSNDSDYVM